MSHSNIGRRTRASVRVARNWNEEMQDQYERRLENDRQRHAALRSGRRETHESKHFLANVLAFNSCFQMTSFGATSIYRDNFMPTFRVIIFELWIWNRGIWVE